MDSFPRRLRCNNELRPLPAGLLFTKVYSTTPCSGGRFIYKRRRWPSSSFPVVLSTRDARTKLPVNVSVMKMNRSDPEVACKKTHIQLKNLSFEQCFFFVYLFVYFLPQNNLKSLSDIFYYYAPLIIHFLQTLFKKIIYNK